MDKIRNDANSIRDELKAMNPENGDLSVINIVDSNIIDTRKKELNTQINNKLKELNGMLAKISRIFTKESEDEKNKRIEEIAELVGLQEELKLVGGNNKSKGGKRKTRRNIKKNKKNHKKTAHRRR
jgi:hypothetical protein